MGCGKSKVAVIETTSKRNENPKPANNQVFDPNPPIKPPKLKKKDAVPAPESFAAIDEHALKAPRSVRSSVSSLAQYLIKPARNDMEKIRSFYRWIAENISYDIAGLTSGNPGPQTAEAVLQRGSAVCEGYSTLFLDLCNDIGISCKKVSGFSKAFGYNPEKNFTENSETSHAWNIVFINGEWRPIESTWGTGHRNKNNKFEKDFKELYFLTDPEDFVIKHFPFMDKNLSASLPLQLLKQPVSLDKFNTALCPQTKGIEWGFESSTHNTQIITADRDFEVKFRTCNIVLEAVMGHLNERNTKKNYKQYILLTRTGDSFSLKVTPPAVGTYDLELFGKPVGSMDVSYPMLMSYVVHCQSVLKEVHPYPDKSGVWGANSDAKRYGFTDDIFRYDTLSTENGEADIRIKTVKQIPVSLKLSQSEAKKSDLNRFVFEYYDEDTLVIKARFPHAGFYKLTLFAKDPEIETTKSTLDHVADFLIDSKKGMTSVQPFPGTYTAAQKYGCLLIEPLKGDLPANQDVHLKLRSNQLTRLMVNKTVHEKVNEEFDITFKTPGKGETVGVFGSPNSDGSFGGLYVFNIV